MRSGLYTLALIVAAHSAFAQTLQGRWKVLAAEDFTKLKERSHSKSKRRGVPITPGSEQKRFFRFENGKLLFGPAPNSIRDGSDTLTRRLCVANCKFVGVS